MVTVPVAVRAQLTFTTNNGAITITGYTGANGAIVIPATTNGYSVVSIDYRAFFNGQGVNYSQLTSIMIPDSVTNIGDFAFYGCSGLTNVNLGASLISIGTNAFAACTGLTYIALPASVSSIGDGAFNVCTKLASVYLPRNLASIGNNVFSACHALTSITIPASVTNIVDYAFAACSTLKAIYFVGNAPAAGSNVFYDDTGITAYYLPETLGWGTVFDGLPAVLWNPQAQVGDGSFGVGINGFGFNITGTANIPIVVEATTNLADAPRTELLNCTLTNGMIYFSDPQWTNYPGRFYRIRSP
jgi:hypothetical protein